MAANLTPYSRDELPQSTDVDAVFGAFETHVGRKSRRQRNRIRNRRDIAEAALAIAAEAIDAAKNGGLFDSSGYSSVDASARSEAFGDLCDAYAAMENEGFALDPAERAAIEKLIESALYRIIMASLPTILSGHPVLLAIASIAGSPIVKLIAGSVAEYLAGMIARITTDITTMHPVDNVIAFGRAALS